MEIYLLKIATKYINNENTKLMNEIIIVIRVYCNDWISEIN